MIKIFFLKISLIYLLERESKRAYKQGEWAEGEAGSPLSKEPDRGHSIPGHQDHDLSRRQMLNQMSHPGVPKIRI